MKGKRVLVHICCAPCFVAPWHHLQEEGYAVHGFWFNHNIHPYTEYRKRLETLQEFAQQQNIPLIVKDEYPLEMFLRNAAFRESDRCRSCYYERLKYAAIIAARGKIDYFTTTLLYSKFQNHAMIRQVGEALGKQYGVSFLYRDFREYWKEGIARSKELEMYRQQYCGCIYSERDRYLGKKK